MKFWYFVSSGCSLHIIYTFHSCTNFNLNCFEYSFLHHRDAIIVSNVIFGLRDVKLNKTNCVSPYVAFQVFPAIAENVFHLM